MWAWHKFFFTPERHQFYNNALSYLALNFSLEQTRTSLFRDFFFNRITILWNSIPDDIKLATFLDSFKRKLKSFFFWRLHYVFGGDNIRSYKIICPKMQKSEYKKRMFLLRCFYLILYMFCFLGLWGWVRWVNLVGNAISFYSNTCIYSICTNLEINK